MITNNTSTDKMSLKNACPGLSYLSIQCLSIVFLVMQGSAADHFHNVS